MIKINKKVSRALFCVLMVGTTVHCANTTVTSAPINEPVAQAMYAKVYGLPSGHCKVYKHNTHGFSSYNPIKKLFGKAHVRFYDANNNLLRIEPLFINSQTNKQVVESIQSRLTVLQAAERAEVHAFKGPGNRWIELYDKEGQRIVSEMLTKDPYWSFRFKKNESIPPVLADELRKYVSNPDVLRVMPVSRLAHDGPSIWGPHEVEAL
jgi:hypothetical protein